MKTRRAFFSAPQRGGFCSSWKEGERLRPITGRRVLLLLEEGENGCAPHFFFSRERKRNVPRPVQRKRALGAALRAESCSFFFCTLRPDSGFPGAMRTGFTACAAAADGCGWAGLRAGTNGFRCESRFFFLCVYLLMAAPWCWADWFYRLRR